MEEDLVRSLDLPRMWGRDENSLRAAQAFILDLDDWEEWVDHEDPRERPHFGGESFWDSWAQRGEDVAWDANNEAWRLV